MSDHHASASSDAPGVLVNPWLEPTEAARLAGVVVEGEVSSSDGSTTTLVVLDALVPRTFASPTISIAAALVPLEVGEVGYFFLDGPQMNRVLYITRSRTVAERVLAGLPPSEPMPSVAALRQLADGCDVLVRGLAHPSSPTTARLDVLSIISASAAGRAALGAPPAGSIEISIAPPADGSAAGGWHWTFDVGADAQRIGVTGHYLLARDGANWHIINPVHPTLLTSGIVRELGTL